MTNLFFLNFLLWPSFSAKEFNTIYSDLVFDILVYRNFFSREIYSKLDLNCVVSNGFNNFNLNIISDSAKKYSMHYNTSNHSY